MMRYISRMNSVTLIGVRRVNTFGKPEVDGMTCMHIVVLNLMKPTSTLKLYRMPGSDVGMAFGAALMQLGMCVYRAKEKTGIRPDALQ